VRYLIVYHQRLGDIVHLFAGAKHLADQGHEVLIECNHRYHDIFRCANYVTPSSPFNRPDVDVILPLQIHEYVDGGGPRFEEYRHSGQSWGQFVYDRTPELAGSYGPPVFTDYFEMDDQEDDRPIVAPYGYSQKTPIPPEVVLDTARRLFGRSLYILTDQPHEHRMDGHLYVKRLRELPAVIRRARDFMTINTSTSIIAAGAREAGTYWHIQEPVNNFQDDTLFGGKVLMP